MLIRRENVGQVVLGQRTKMIIDDFAGCQFARRLSQSRHAPNGKHNQQKRRCGSRPTEVAESEAVPVFGTAGTADGGSHSPLQLQWCTMIKGTATERCPQRSQ